MEQYSRLDLTMDLYASDLVSSCLICKFLLRKPKILFAFVVMLLMWGSQDILLDKVTPRYLAVCTDSSVCPLRM